MQNLCLNILFENNAIGPYEFNLQSKINGYDSWYNSANNLTIFFNKNNNYWEILNIDTIINAKLRNTTTLNIPIGSWSIVGLVPSGNAIVTSGTCSTYPPLSIRTKVANNTCPKKCNGAIFASAIGDNKPYKFSIDNGVTYTSNPIFNNLCEGEYNIRVSGQTGSVASEFVTVSATDSSQIYSLSLEDIAKNQLIEMNVFKGEFKIIPDFEQFNNFIKLDKKYKEINHLAYENSEVEVKLEHISLGKIKVI